MKPTDFVFRSLLNKIRENLSPETLLHIYFIDKGVNFLSDAYWEQIYQSSILFYADASDAKEHGMKYREEIIFSGKKSFALLEKIVDQIIHITDPPA